MKRLTLKVRNRWSRLALHTRITISMIGVLMLGLSVSAIITYRLFLDMLTNRVGRKVLIDFGQDDPRYLDLPPDRAPGRSNDFPSDTPGDLREGLRDNFGGQAILPEERQRVILHGPGRDEFFARIGQEVSSSLMLFFIATTLAVTFAGALCVYFLTRKALRKVQGEQARLKEFVANASHDLRTPLAVISGYAQLLALKDTNTQDTQEFASHISQNANRMQNLVEDMLLTTRLDEEGDSGSVLGSRLSEGVPAKMPQESAQEKVNQQVPEYDIYDLLESLVNDFTQIYTKPSILLESDSIFVQFPPDDIHRIVQNLLTNACRYAGEDAKVKVISHKTAGQVVLKVSDTGVGVHKQKLEYIFERFTKLDSSRNTQGNGLGLSIVKDLVLKLGGSVRAMSTDQQTGRGLTVEVVLPI